MIRFNNEEYSSKFVNENKIIEINSIEKDFPTFIEQYRNALKGEGEMPAFDYSAYRLNDGDFYPVNKDHKDVWNRGTDVFNEVLTVAEAEAYEDALAIKKRPYEFAQFERFQFNQEHAFPFTETEVSNDEMLQELYSAYGILPTLWESDKSVRELKSLSVEGYNLIRMSQDEKYVISKYNPVPPEQWIELYKKMSPYEKKIVTNGRVHPAKIMNIVKGIQDVYPGYALRQDMLDYIIARKENGEAIDAKSIVSHFSEDYAKDNEDMLKKLEEKFKEKFHGRAPRVLNEYAEGVIAGRGLKESTLSDADLDSIVSGFSQTNVSKIAKYRAPLLFSLGETVNFAGQKENVIQALASSIPTSRAISLNRIGFGEWLNAHPDVKIDQLIKICNLAPSITHIDVNMPAKEIIDKIELKEGYEDARRFENKNVYKQQGYKFANNEIAIRGRHIVAKQGNLTMRMLAADDYKNFMVGKITHCCQRYGNAGESCVYKYTTDPFAACVVIERGDQIVAQGFVWTDEQKDVFVFDNVELANDRDVRSFSDLFAKYAEALPYKNVHIGTGYNQGMNGWGKPVDFDRNNQIFAKMPTTLDGRTNITGWGGGNCYSDYHVDGGSKARTIKHLGSMKLVAHNPVQITRKPDEPTKWDKLAFTNMNFMLNDYKKTPEERIRIAEEFLSNPTKELQIEVIKSNPDAIIALETPCEEAQKLILEKNRIDLLSKISNPIPEVRIALLDENPEEILEIENPTEDMVCKALSKNAMIIKDLPVSLLTERACIQAVEQNGYCFRFIPDEFKTRDVQMAAVNNEMKAIFEIDTPHSDVLNKVIAEAPVLVATLKNLTPEIQVALANSKPSTINIMENPCPEAVRTAIEKDGLMIRNFQNQYPELRQTAVAQNGYAIRVLHNPTIEEARRALAQNPLAECAIKDPELREQLNLNSVVPEMEDIELD